MIDSGPKSNGAHLSPGPSASNAGVNLDDPRVHRAMEEYLDLLEAGQRPDRAAFLARFPEVADALALCLQGLDFSHAAEPELGDGDAPPPDLGPGIGSTTLGDFRILREIGRGGMGVVYEAEQVSLGRRVALKVLPFAGALESKHLQRFKTEAQAAAQLHHTNIVPIHYVGCERGIHFYAMQYIDGQSLDAVIRELREAEGKKKERDPATPAQLSAADQAAGSDRECGRRSKVLLVLPSLGRA